MLLGLHFKIYLDFICVSLYLLFVLVQMDCSKHHKHQLFVCRC